MVYAAYLYILPRKVTWRLWEFRAAILSMYIRSWCVFVVCDVYVITYCVLLSSGFIHKYLRSGRMVWQSQRIRVRDWGGGGGAKRTRTRRTSSSIRATCHTHHNVTCARWWYGLLNWRWTSVGKQPPSASVFHSQFACGAQRWDSFMEACGWHLQIGRFGVVYIRRISKWFL